MLAIDSLAPWPFPPLCRLSGLSKDKSKSSTALKPPPLPQPLALTAAEEYVDMNSQSETNGLEFLDQPPPDLTGVDGTIFAVATDIDIRSPLLLDILADKPQAPQHKRDLLCRPQPPLFKKLQSCRRSQNGANGRYISIVICRVNLAVFDGW